VLNNVTFYPLQSQGYGNSWQLNNTPNIADTPTYTHVGSTTAGIYNYATVVNDLDSGCQALSNTISVWQDSCQVINPGDPLCNLPPDADFALATYLSGCNIWHALPLIDGTPTNIYWNFGDNTTLNTLSTTAQEHTYALPGYYHPTVIVSFQDAENPNEQCVLVVKTLVTVPLAADFDVTGNCVGQDYAFIDHSLYLYGTNLLDWAWDFGDGSPIVTGIQNPTHQYNTAGTYQVSLSTTSDACTHTITKPIEVHALPNATIVASDTVCVNNAISFAASNNNLTLYNWAFGDGGTANTATALHSYNNAANYQVQLNITDQYGCSNTATPVSITALLPNINPIIAPDTVACANQTLTLTAPPDGIAYLWSGNGGTNATLIVSQTGAYSVQVTQANGCRYTTPPQYVTFNALPSSTIGSNMSADLANGDTLFVCGGNEVWLSVGSDNDNIVWNTGSTNQLIVVPNTSPFTGTYYATLSNTQTTCQTTSDTITVVRNALPQVSIQTSTTQYYICEGQSMQLSASTNAVSPVYLWSTGSTNPSISINQAGIYQVSITNQDGCLSTAQIGINVKEQPDMSSVPFGCFEWCNLQPISPVATYSSYQWLFSNQLINNNTNTLYPTQSGDYQLVASNIWGCMDTSEVLSLAITDCSICTATANFAAGYYTYLGVQFTELCLGSGVLSWQWTFGDGTTSTQANPMHQYNAAANYQVCLIVNNVLGNATCTDTLCKTVNVQAILPVELLQFVGTVVPQGNQLKWITATEINNHYFTLQRSTDGQTFTNIAQIKGAGNSNTQQVYGFLDKDAPTGTVYYQLQQTNFDGQTNNVGLVTLSRKTTDLTIVSLAPIPTNDQLHISFDIPTNQTITIALFDVVGKLIYQKQVPATAGNNVATINVQPYTAGVYILQIGNGMAMQYAKVVVE
jgi:PKD repeat protein